MQLDFTTAYGLLLEWNFDGHAQPPWPVGGPNDRLVYKLPTGRLTFEAEFRQLLL